MARLTAAQHRATARKAALRSSRARVTARNRAHDRGTDANPELIAAAVARLDPYYGLAIVEDDPYARDGYFGFDAIDDGPPTDCPLRSSHREPRPCVLANGHDNPCQYAPRRTAQPVTMSAPPRTAHPTRADDGAELAPCPRCSRADWQTAKGRQWHLDNNPRCADMPRKAEHQYAAVR